MTRAIALPLSLSPKGRCRCASNDGETTRNREQESICSSRGMCCCEEEGASTALEIFVQSREAGASELHLKCVIGCEGQVRGV